MDLSLTTEQEMLKTAVRGFIQQEYPKETLLEIAAEEQPVTAEPWQRLVSTGWLGIAIPQEYGGEGGSFTDSGVLFEELGRGPVPGPHLSSCVLAASAILEGGTEEQKREWLPALARGERILVPALTEGSYSWAEEDVQVVARQDGGGLRLDGTKVYVFDAVSATHLLCTARSEESNEVGLVIVPVTATGVAIRSLPGFTWNMAEVKLNGVSVDQSNLIGSSFAGGWDALQKAIARTIPVMCAYQVGACQSVYELSVDYSRTRIQFGRPIGRFQRVEDHIINLVNQLDAARWTTYETLWKLDSGQEATDSIHLAKAVGSAAYYQACNFAHEVHAGVGSMTEYGLTLHTTASRTLYHYLGDPQFHRRRLADALSL
jgi:alkylation response protein AidB-like acyl-CoA dehydrogenase